MFKEKTVKFFKKAATSFIVLTTIVWSLGFPVMPIVRAVSPYVMMVEYINPTTFQVKFDQLMNELTISTASFALTTVATDTETITSVTPSTVSGKTVVTVLATGAKISPSAGDYVVVDTSGANAPENTGAEDNADGGMIGFVAQPGQVVISEIKLSGSSETDEFIEIYNPTGSTVDITGWKVTLLAQDGTPTDLVTFGAVTVPAGSFRLIAPTGVSNADNYTPGAGGIAANGIDSNNTIILYQAIGGGMFRSSDMVGCGTAVIKETTAISACPSANTSIERKASPAATTASMDASLSPAGAQSGWGNGYDSNNNNFDFVLETAGGVNPQTSLSAVETPGGGGGGYQNQPPTINHMPVFQVVSGQSAMFIAMIADPETPPQGLTANMVYSTNNWTGSTTLVGQNISGNEFKFIVPAADTGAGSGTAFKYYLKATDANSNSSCMYNMGGVCGTADATAKTGSWTVTSASSAGMTNSIKGKVMSGATGIDGAMVTLRGAGLTFNATSATDGAAGTFTFANIPTGMFRLEASASGYSIGWLDGIVSKSSGAAYTDNIINLVSGGGGGQGGDMVSPRVIFSAPMDGMMGAPTKINIPAAGDIEAPIMIGFSKAMDSTTITSDNIKIYPVTAAGLGTALAGVSVAYQVAGSQATLIDRANRQVSFGPDNLAIVYSATALTANSQYVVDLSSSVKDSAGNILQGNKSGGGHSISFTTGGDFSSFTSGQMTTGFNTFMAGGGGGQYTPPYVTGSNPSNGAKNIPTNSKLVVNFSQPMDSVGINATSGVGTYVKIYNVTTGQYISVESIALDVNTKQMATITVGGSGLTASSNYAIRVLGGAKSATGMTMAMPGQESNVMYQADFSAGTGSDIGAPAVLGSTLQNYTVASSCTGATVCITGVPTNVGVIELSFSKDMDSSTINSSNITLKSGTTDVSSTISYDSMSRSIKVTPNTVLYTVTTYTLTVGVGVKAMNGTALTASYIISFTTNSTVDSTGPTVMMANADDYKLAITFSEPMNAAKATDTTNWAASVLNPTNYVLYTNNSPPPFVLGTNTAKYFSNNNLATATDAASGGPVTLKYDAAYNTVFIEGLKLMDSSLTIKGGFNVWIQNVKDISGNVIQDTIKPANVNDFGANGAGGPVNNSSATFGNIGPGGGGMSGPPTASSLSGGAMAVTAFGGKNPAMMGFKPVNVSPMNMLAGQESMYMIDLPLTTAIPALGQIILTFPVGFDVTNATDADPNKKWAHKDINGPGTGTVVIASVAANATSRTVTITLGAVATQANDFVHLEIDRIKNTTKSSDGNMATGVTMGSGYQVDIYTKTAQASGSVTLDSLKSMPFFIKAAGVSTDKLTGTITFKNVAGANAAVTLTGLPIYLSSPMTGPLKTLVDFSNSATGTYTFSNLPTGMYMLGTDPLQTISSVDYYVDINPMPQSLGIVTGTNTKNIVFQAQDQTTKPNLTVYITGTFSNESIDIFAGGPSGFSVKTVTLNGTFTNASPSTQTVYLPNIGTWMIGMGPAIPRGPQQSGPVSISTWMPPKSIEVNVSGSAGTWTWKDSDGAADLDASAADGEITFGVISANRTISGHVYGPTGSTGIQNANINAFSPMGGMASFAESGSDGAFSLKVSDGTYQVSVFVPGMPPSAQVPVEVKTVGAVTTVYANGEATTDLILRMQNPASMYTISGKVTDGTNVIKDASVYAHRTDAPGNLGTKTDSMGKYILYVSAGTWAVGVFLPQYGNLTEQTVIISTASEADIDFAPAVGTTFRTVKDLVYKDIDNSGTYAVGDTLLSNVHVDFDKTGYHNTAMTDQNGQYSILVPDGVYTVTAWSPDTGKIPPQSVIVAADMNVTGNADLPVADTKTVTINFKDGSDNAVSVPKVYVQMDKLGSKDVSNETSRENVSSLNLAVPAGTDFQYVLDIEIPGVLDNALTVTSPTAGAVTGNDIDSDLTNDIYQAEVEGNLTLNVVVPTLYAVSGAAQDDSGNPLPNTTINIKRVDSDEVATTVTTDASGNYSVRLPASGSDPYLFQVDKAGYIDTGLSVTVDGIETQNLSAEASTLAITGQITVSSSGVEGAKVYARELGGGFASTETDAQGNYVLPVTAGDWKISATSDGYQEKEYQNASNQDIVVSLSAADQTGINLALTAAKTGLADMNNADVNPSAGATFEDSSAGLELIAPQNAIATSQGTYQIEDYETANVASSPTAQIIGGEAIALNTYEPSGSSMVPKTSFSDDITIEKKYTLAELGTIDTFAETEAVKMSYFDESSSNWEPVLTDIVYLNSSEQPVIPTNTLSNVTYIVYSGVSDHMTVYSPTNGSPDGLAPSAPTSVSGSASSNQITVSWTAPTTNTDTTALADLLGYEVYRSTSSAGTYTQINASDVAAGTTSYIDSAVSSGVTYYYKITAADTGGIESSMSIASSGVAAYSSGGGGSVYITPSPSPTLSPSPTPTPTPSPSPIVSPNPTPVVSPIPTPAVSPVPSASQTPAVSLVWKEIPTLSANPTTAEIQAAINIVINNIAYLTAELNKLLTGGFSSDLYYGLLGNNDVRRLQDFLIGKSYLGAGLNSGNYLSLTVQAIKAYQTAKGIAPANGRCGPKTRAAINADLGL